MKTKTDGRRKQQVAILQRGGDVRLLGYARVSTADQSTDTQRETLLAAGCEQIFTDTASGGIRTRPGLDNAIAALRPGDTLLFTRLDRVARSLVNLLEIVRTVAAKGAGFRSLSDPFDITSPQGRLMMQMLGSFAEFERALIQERTYAGMAAARARGAMIGNPAIRSQDPIQLALMRVQRADTILERSRNTIRPHLNLIRRLRPDAPWSVVLDHINTGKPEDEHMHVTTLKTHIRRLVKAGEIDPLDGRAMGETASASLSIAADRLKRDPETSYRDLATFLNEEGLKPARANQWTEDRLRRALKRSGFKRPTRSTISRSND